MLPLRYCSLQIHQPDEHTELVLNAAFARTIAFHLWHTLKQEQYPDPAALSSTWQADIQQLVRHIRDVFSVGRSTAECTKALEEVYCRIAFTDPPLVLTTAFQPSDQGFTAVPDRENLLPYMFDKLMLSARKVRRKTAGLPPDSAQEQADSNAPVWQESGPAGGPVGMRTCTHLLQSMLVLWKLAFITGCMSRSVQTPDSRTGLTTLFETIAGLCDQLKAYDQSAAQGVTLPPQAEADAEAGTAEAEAEGNKQLSLLLVLLVLRTMPMMVGQWTTEPDVCCKIMSALMMRSQPSTYQAVAKVIVEKGRVADSLRLVAVVYAVKCQPSVALCIQLVAHAPHEVSQHSCTLTIVVCTYGKDIIRLLVP